MVFLLVFGDYFFKEILIDNLLINDTKEISIHKEYYNDTLYRLEISDYPCNETFFNCSQTIFKTKNEMISIFVINQNTDSVGVVIYYQNPKPFDGENRVFEFFDYNKDTVGIYNYIWLYEYTKPDKFDEDTLFIKRCDMIKYKKCDTIYLKPYL